MALLPLSRASYLKVRVIESVDNVPSQHEELPPLDEQAVEEAESKQQLLVLEVSLAAGEGVLIDQLVETFHVCLQTLQRQQRQGAGPQDDKHL